MKFYAFKNKEQFLVVVAADKSQALEIADDMGFNRALPYDFREFALDTPFAFSIDRRFLLRELWQPANVSAPSAAE